MTLILASSSAIRRAMLDQAGVPHSVVPAAIDEDCAKRPGASPDAIALDLAQAKALAVSASNAADWVIGSDSVVSVDGRLFSKPGSKEEAAEHLRAFSGKTMILVSAVALAREGAVAWSHCDSARLQVRDLSDAFIAHYIDREWPAVSYCVGVFRMEGPGVQLFEGIDGSHFTILGMPLLPLLRALREQGVLES